MEHQGARESHLPQPGGALLPERGRGSGGRPVSLRGRDKAGQDPLSEREAALWRAHLRSERQAGARDDQEGRDSAHQAIRRPRLSRHRETK